MTLAALTSTATVADCAPLAACFHCNEPLRGSLLTVHIDGRSQPVCCAGCQAVAELISGAGLADFYRYRDAPSPRPDTPDSDAWSAYARPDVAMQFVSRSDTATSVTLLIEGLRCSACSWLIDRVLRTLPGVQEVSVNAATARAHLAWDDTRSSLAEVMRRIAQLGYRPQPLTRAGVAHAQRDERHDMLKRLAVAAFGMMQVMMFAVAIYAADLAGETIDPGMLDYFRIVSLLVATPVMFYAGAPFLVGAWRSLRTRSVGMDVPIGIALLLAYGASVWNTLASGSGEVYFDSVSMFIFFLTLGRFVQMSVRHRTGDVTDALARQLPALAHRLESDGMKDVPVATLRCEDVIVVRHGEIVPADGELADRHARLDEALLTGESLPVERGAAERVIAGTLNVGDPLRLRVTSVGAGTVLSQIVALLNRAQARKPTLTRTADHYAARFLQVVLLAAGTTCAAWLAIDPARAFEATLAVLVVACPCAFAIAMPAALSAATAQLARRGVLVTQPGALESLAQVNNIVFDKTGTLTSGDVSITHCVTHGDVDQRRCREIAAALEQTSEHPLARAFRCDATGDLQAHDVRAMPGRGVDGVVDGRRYRLGAAEFVAELRDASRAPLPSIASTGSLVTLGDEQRELAVFALHDTLRPSAGAAVRGLRDLDIAPRILSGDSLAAVRLIADRCEIPEYVARQAPSQKLAHVRALQDAGHRVAMVGDGVNDAPVLGTADVSIAMGHGVALAQATADIVLVREDLRALPETVLLARRALRIARQNLTWSAVYNFSALPLAALGLVPPWLAALGMSVSSIAVMLNATRLLPRTTRRAGDPGSVS